MNEVYWFEHVPQKLKENKDGSYGIVQSSQVVIHDAQDKDFIIQVIEMRDDTLAECICKAMNSLTEETINISGEQQ